MQVSEVLTGTHTDLADQLNALAATVTIQNVQKTVSSGKFVVVYDDATPGGQTAGVIVGDPETLAADLQILINSGEVINLVTPTFSAAHYVVVRT